MIAAAASSTSVPAAAPATVVSATGSTSSADAKIAEAATGFESMFMDILVGEMFKGTDLGGDSAYGSMMTSAFSDSLAGSGGVGLAAMLTRQMGGDA